MRQLLVTVVIGHLHQEFSILNSAYALLSNTEIVTKIVTVEKLDEKEISSKIFNECREILKKASYSRDERNMYKKTVILSVTHCFIS